MRPNTFVPDRNSMFLHDRIYLGSVLLQLTNIDCGNSVVISYPTKQSILDGWCHTCRIDGIWRVKKWAP